MRERTLTGVSTFLTGWKQTQFLLSESKYYDYIGLTRRVTCSTWWSVCLYYPHHPYIQVLTNPCAVTTGIFRNALPSFKALREFEWIGYPELRADAVQAVLSSHPHLRSLGLIGWHFDAIGVSAFRNLRKFTLRAEDDDGVADMDEIKAVLDKNEGTLRHLTLGAYLQRQHSWDNAFQSATIRNLTHLDLVDTRISHVVLARIAHAHSLKSLTLHGTFEEPCSASVVFGSDHIIGGRHTFLPHLEAFRFVMVGHDDDLVLFQSVAQFLKQRPKLRRLDLGSCPLELVLGALPELTSLRVLRIRIAKLNQLSLGAVLKALPQEMVAIHLSVAISDKPLVRTAAFKYWA